MGAEAQKHRDVRGLGRAGVLPDLDMSEGVITKSRRGSCANGGGVGPHGESSAAAWALRLWAAVSEAPNMRLCWYMRTDALLRKVDTRA